jgi:uncharacterized integral membrane protein (TIGR00697 family)
MSAAAPVRQYRYYEYVMAAVVTVLICANLIGPAKISQVDLPLVGTLVFGAGVLFFPISYVFGDILTEVYGYARARRVIWAGFGGLAFASFMAYVVVALPPAPFWKNQEAYDIAFGQAWRIAGASMIAYFCGEFVNSFVLAKMKIATAGRWLWTRTIGSTIAGEAVDSALFYPIAFYGTGASGSSRQASREARRVTASWRAPRHPWHPDWCPPSRRRSRRTCRSSWRIRRRSWERPPDHRRRR